MKNLPQLIFAFVIAAIGNHIINTAADASRARIREITTPDEEPEQEKEEPENDK